MAALGSYDYRDPTLEDYLNYEHALDVIQRKGNTKQEFKMLFMECTMPSGATMIAADAGRTGELDGVATPIIVYAISSDNVEDKAGQDGALEVTVFGIDETDNYNEEVFVLTGTTQVVGVIKWQRLIAAKLTKTGVDGVGTGNVTITNTGQAVQYLLIPAGQKGSAQAGKVWVASGWKAMIINFDAHFINLPGAAAFSRVEGSNIWIRRYKGGTNPVTEDELHQYTISTSKVLPSNPHWEIIDGQDDALFDIFHQSVNTGNDFITSRIAQEFPRNDGKQTPMKNHPVFIAQHATATCCRGCIQKWHKIPEGKALHDDEIQYLVNLVMKWIELQMKGFEKGK